MGEDVVKDSMCAHGKFLRGAILSGVSLIALPCSSAWAQDATVPQKAPSAPQDAYSDIVVTAQRREQSLQDVPIAVSAFNERFLQQRNITSLEQLGNIAPNVKIERGASNTTVAQITIRGATTINPSLTWEPTVGVYLDGVYLGKAQGGFFDVADIARVEVLRGPQGTLYGRNTLAGAINIITQKPTGEFGGKAQVSYGNYDFRQFRGTVDLPSFGAFSVKLSGQITKRDGFYKVVPNPLPGVPLAGQSRVGELDNQNSRSFMAQVRFRPTDTLTFDYAFDYSKVNQRPGYSQPYSVYPGGIFDPASPAYPFAGAVFPYDRYVNKDRQRKASIDADVFERPRVYGHSLTGALNLGDIGELKSITAYRNVKFDDRLDLDGSPLPLAESARNSDYHFFSQELQISGKTGRLNYVVGLFYSADNAKTLNPQTFFAGASQYDSRYSGKTKSFAAFGQLDYRLTDTLTLTGGLRLTKERKTISRLYGDLVNPGNSFAYNLDDVPGPDVPAGFLSAGQIFTTPRAKYSNVTPTLVVSYNPVSELNLYAKFAKGFKSGGFNGESSDPGELASPYRPEKLDSYEIGLKSRLFDNHLTLNLAAFWNESKDLQLSVFTGQGAVSSVVLNAGKARIRGLEVEAVARPVDSLTVTGSFAYLDPKYKSFIDGGQDVANNRAFSHAPHYQANGSVDWRVFQLDSGTRLNLIADVAYTARYFIFPFALRAPVGSQTAYNTQAPARTVVDLRAVISEIDMGGAKWSLTAFGRNVFDVKKELTYIDFGPSFGGLTTANYIAPRTYGLTLGTSF
jgi:iron complex outermembrane receptor protein